MKKRTVIGIAAAALLGGGLLALLPGMVRPKGYWFVVEAYAAEWGRILASAEPPPPFKAIQVQEEGVIPGGRGYLIGTRLPDNSADTPVRVFQDLFRTREYQGALALALDPWMVFRKHQDHELTRDRVDSSRGGEGQLLLPGSDPAAVWAWTAQFLQNQPGEFPQDSEFWKESQRLLLQSRRFQNGAPTYPWVGIWPILLREEAAWVYAPLSVVRALPPYRMGLLDASRFPEKPEWNRYGLQANILWAIPAGANSSRRSQKDIGKAEQWLRDPLTQTLIANTLGWIPAHPAGTPYNTASWETQLAWLRSSFVWQQR
jgi:hypothetical protein